MSNLTLAVRHFGYFDIAPIPTFKKIKIAYSGLKQK
jgi:hypothetical protein